MLPPEQLSKAYRTDATVHNMINRGRKPHEVMLALVEEKRALMDRVTQLEAIVPRRYATGDGTILTWHCPDELIPICRIGGSVDETGV